MGDKLKNTEMVVTELTQSLTKVMAENYRRNSSSHNASQASPHPRRLSDIKDSASREKLVAFKIKKESLPLKPNEGSLLDKAIIENNEIMKKIN